MKSQIAHNLSAFYIHDSLRVLIKRLSATYESRIKGLDITVDRLSILSMVGGLEKTSARELGEFLLLEKSTLSRSLKLLSDKELVKQTPSGISRTVYLELTDDAIALLEDASAALDGVEQEVEQMFGETLLKEILARAELTPLL